MTERLKLHSVTLSNSSRNINKELSLKTATLNITFVTLLEFHSVFTRYAAASQRLIRTRRKKVERSAFLTK